jgi:hypothetical protein
MAKNISLSYGGIFVCGSCYGNVFWGLKNPLHYTILIIIDDVTLNPY